jgi:Asp/Glu/hydantoin racemase
MAHKIAFLHTVFPAFGIFDSLVKELLPSDLVVYHITDEILAKVVVAQGGLSPFLYRRVAEHAFAAEQAGAELLQMTCSSISPCADYVSALVGIPVLKVDIPMIDKAFAIGRRIGVAATAMSALVPLVDLVRSRAGELGKSVEVEPAFCEGAYAALFSRGDTATHDRIVLETLKGLMERNEVILLAQASMQRVAEAIAPEEQKVPILASPRLAVEHLRTLLQTATGERG